MTERTETMKEPVKRLAQTILVAIVFLIVYTGVLLYVEKKNYDDLIMADSYNKVEAVRGMIEGYDKTAGEIGKGFSEDENARVRLMAIRLSDQIRDGEYIGDRYSENSMVVRVHNGEIKLPPEAEGLFPALETGMITNEYTQTRTQYNPGTSTAAENDDNQVILTGGRIAGEWYVVKWIPAEQYDEYLRLRMSEDSLMEALEPVNDIELFMIASDASLDTTAEGTDGNAILYKTKGLAKFSTLDELGISRNDIDDDGFSMQTGRSRNYVCFPIELENLGYTLVCCNSVEGEKAAFVGDILAQILFAAVMLAGLITWCFSVQWMVQRERLSEKEKERYSPAVVKKRTTRLAIMSTLVVILFAFTTVMVQYMYQENRTGSNVLDMLETQIEDGKKTSASLHTMDSERYTALGETVSQMLSEDPALLMRERLAEISDAISADYLILYGEDGQETACSREYTGFTLPTDKSEPAYDFRRLLNGIPCIVHEPEKDMITGDTRPFVGIRYAVPGKPDTYGALLIALPTQTTVMAEDIENVVRVVKEQVYTRIQSGDRLIIEVDPSTHRILSSSKSEYAGTDIESLGMDPKGLKDRYMNFYYLDDQWYFGIVGVLGDSLYYSMTDSSRMSMIGLVFALISGGLFAVGYVITAKFALNEYTDENYEKYASEMEKVSEEYMQKIEMKAPSLNSTAVEWKEMLPEMKTKTIIQLLTGIMLVVMIVIAFGNSPLARHSALSFVIKGNWTKGLNLFSVIAVLVTFCVEYLAYLTVKVIAAMLNSLTDSKGETVFRLVRSFLDYAMFIGAVCVALSFLGIDTATLLASLGLLSLAISLGAKDIVADILSGLSLVFERTYFVGDIVKVGDFKGRVMEIGIRSTKIMSATHDVKIISNHEVSGVINYSKESTICVVKISVPVTVSIEELKKLFDQELPAVARNNPYIIRGPKFDGISELVDDKMIINISAEGPEDHIYSIKRDLNQALQSMAERELLQYAQSNITINLEGAKGQNTDRSDPGHFDGKGPEDSGPMQAAQGGDAAQGTEDGESVHEGEEDTSSVRERLKQVRERDKRRGVIRGVKSKNDDENFEDEE